jgi:16S rRNA U1498 N3-methylase RsmE
VLQPESDFVFRMKDGPRCALFEADGGAWQNEAIDNIKKHLEASLKSEIENKRITIIA